MCEISDGWLFSVIGLVWIGTHLSGLVFSKTFRKTYKDWLTFKDPFGTRIWTKNRWYVWFVAIFSGGFLVFFFFCGGVKNG